MAIYDMDIYFSAIPLLLLMYFQTYLFAKFVPTKANHLFLFLIDKLENMISYSSLIYFIIGWLLCLSLSATTNTIETSACNSCIMRHLHMYRPLAHITEHRRNRTVSMTIHIAEIRSKQVSNRKRIGEWKPYLSSAG